MQLLSSYFLCVGCDTNYSVSTREILLIKPISKTTSNVGQGTKTDGHHCEIAFFFFSFLKL